jgi:hypothetical protein
MDKESFISKVNTDIGTTKCWLWCGENKRNNPRLLCSGWTIETYAPRISYSLFKEPISKYNTIVHTCGNGICVRPDHLERSPFVESKIKRSSRKYKEFNLKDITKLHSSGSSYTKLSNTYGLCVEQIWYALN